MKTCSLMLLLVVIFSDHACAQFSITYHFHDDLRNPRSTGIYQGTVYGITDLDFTDPPEEAPIANLFAFDLDGANLRSRNIHDEIGGYALWEIGRGPLAIQDGVIYATMDLRDVFTASTTDLVATRRTRLSGNWVNPVLINAIVAPAESGGSYGLVFDPLDGTPDSFVPLLSNTPVSSITTDGTSVFAATLGRVPDYQGSIVSVSADGMVSTIRNHFDDTFSLAYSNDRIYGFGDEGLYGINTDGTGFEILNDEIVGTRIIVAEDTIYGLATATYDNRNEPEKLFAIQTDGSGYEVLHEFGAGADNGIGPNPDLVVIGSTLYGSTYGGGENDRGTYYSFELDASSPAAVPEPASVVSWLVLLICGVGWCNLRRCRLR